ncbi:hypothetical protein COBT_002248 [Conglomerata obtusa]
MDYDDFVKKLLEKKFKIERKGELTRIHKGNAFIDIKDYENINYENFLKEFKIKQDNITNECHQDVYSDVINDDHEFSNALGEEMCTSKSSVEKLLGLENVDQDANTNMYFNMNKNDDRDSNIFNIGDQDLFPGRISGHGMFLEPDHPIFGERQERHKHDGTAPPLARYDPVVPEPARKDKKKKRGNDPDPDHFKNPGGDNNYFM